MRLKGAEGNILDDCSDFAEPFRQRWEKMILILREFIPQLFSFFTFYRVPLTIVEIAK